MQVHMHLSKAVIVKKIVKTTDHSIGAFPTISSLVCQKIDLARQSFTGYAKYRALPRCKEVDGAWLQWIGRIVYLLRIIKGIVHFDIPGVAGCAQARWWWCKGVFGCKVSTNTLFTLIADGFIVLPLHSHNS